MNVISPESKIEMFFEIRLTNGSVVDSNFDKQPVVFTIGDGNMLAGFESVLIGLTEGDRKTFLLEPEQGFGVPNPSNFQTIERKKFVGMELEEGLMVSFQDPSGELPGVVSSFDDVDVIVDFNHPLSGKNLEFEVEITKIFAD